MLFANKVLGRNIGKLDEFCADCCCCSSCACANMRSARLPCRSLVGFPSASFFKAYCTIICRLPPKYCPFMHSIAVSEA